MSAQPYSAYRNTGVEWLGPVPSHWQVSRLNALFREVSEPGSDELPVLSVSIHSGVSDTELADDETDRMVARSEDRSKYKRVEPNDLVYNMMRAWQGGFGAVQTVGAVSPAYVVARPTSSQSTRFVERLLRTSNAVSEMKRLSKGVTDFRLRLYWDEFKNIKVALPPPDEQVAIDAFLDRETAKIDALVEVQERLIALLKEKRQAVISHAATKGLDPAAPMKDSGIEWLGQVPAHWSTTKLGHVCSKIGSGKTPSGGAEAYVDDGIAFLRSQNVYDEGLWLDELVYISEQTDEEMANTRVLPGDILLNITGASLSRTSIVPDNFERANVNQHVCILRLGNASLRDFVSLVMKSFPTKGQIDALQNGAAREGLNFKQISSIVIALPPLDEARAIFSFVLSEVSILDRMTTQAEAAITLLQERRAALISAAVTGKIDVRGLVAPVQEASAA